MNDFEDDECEDCDDGDCGIYDDTFDITDIIPSGEEDPVSWWHFIGFLAANYWSAKARARSVVWMGIASTYAHRGRYKQRQLEAQKLERQVFGEA